jgi:pimeloyl-ACP methyl ester carboxylesterase
VKGATWKFKQTFYILGAHDRTAHPELQRFVAERMNAKVTVLDSSHVPMLSQPERVYQVIREAAETIA